MKEDYRYLLTDDGIPPYWTKDGMPIYSSRRQLTRCWLEGKFKIIFCQSCWLPFLVVQDFSGDPPVHDRSDGKPCIGDTMLHLDPLNRIEDFGCIQQDYAHRYALKLRQSFWCRDAAGEWRTAHRSKRAA